MEKASKILEALFIILTSIIMIAHIFSSTKSLLFFSIQVTTLIIFVLAIYEIKLLALIFSMLQILAFDTGSISYLFTSPIFFGISFMNDNTFDIEIVLVSAFYTNILDGGWYMCINLAPLLYSCLLIFIIADRYDCDLGNKLKDNTQY